MLPSFKQIFLCEFLQAGRGKGQSFWVFFFLKNNQLQIISQKAYFGVENYLPSNDGEEIFRDKQ